MCGSEEFRRVFRRQDVRITGMAGRGQGIHQETDSSRKSGRRKTGRGLGFHQGTGPHKLDLLRFLSQRVYEKSYPSRASKEAVRYPPRKTAP